MTGGVAIRTVGHMTETTSTSAIDQATVEEFTGELIGLYTGGLLTYMVDIGHRTGLFDAAAERPGTSQEIADRAGLQERYVREWLGAMVTGGIFRYDAVTATYSLPAEHALCLSGPGAFNLAPLSQLSTHLGKYVHQVARAFSEGGGVPYEEFRPEFTGVMDGLNRGIFDGLMVDDYLPLAPGLRQRLEAGARVADVCCGTGHSLVVLGEAFPASTFFGYDIDDEAIALGRKEAAEAGLTNVTFEVRDVAELSVEQPFDVVFVFYAIHDQVDPTEVLDRIHDSLVPGGTFFLDEPRVSSNLEDNVGNPAAPMLYAISTLHCLTVSLAHDGAGLGTAWGEQLALQMLADAGFGPVEVFDAPGDPTNAVFVTHRPAG